MFKHHHECPRALLGDGKTARKGVYAPFYNLLEKYQNWKLLAQPIFVQGSNPKMAITLLELHSSCEQAWSNNIFHSQLQLLFKIFNYNYW